jgi:hypothetical protein
MALRLIGVDPDSPNNGSPTVWVDEDDQSIVIQGWKITDNATISEIGEEKCDDSAVAKLCAASFDAAWDRAIPHEAYQPA